MTIVWILALLIIGLFLVFCEVFVPGGVVGAAGVVFMVMSVWLCFETYGLTYGLLLLLACLVLTFVVAIAAFHYFPESKTGKWVIIGDRLGRDSGYTSVAYAGKYTVGSVGITESALRPSGIATFDDERVDVVSEAEYIDPQTRIKIVKVDGNRIVVERV